MTRCFCGHSYRAHAFYRNQTKKVHCRVPGCKCSLFQYVYHRGGRAVKCQCKHDLEKHRDSNGRPVPCKHPGCSCQVFAPTVTCTCGMPASMHETVFERESERAETGRVTRALWNRMEKDGAENPPNDVASQCRGQGLAALSQSNGSWGWRSDLFLSLAPGTREY